MTDDITVRQALAAALGAIEGLSAYAWQPGAVNLPAAVVSRASTDFDKSMARGSDDFEYTVTVLVQYADPEVAQRAMSAYLATAGASSIKAAVELDQTLGGVVDFARVRSAGREDPRQVGDVPCLAVDFTVEVTA